jgi:hypothetical protein
VPARRAVAFLLAVLVSTAAGAQPQQREGIELRDPSALRSLVPADELERAADEMDRPGVYWCLGDTECFRVRLGDYFARKDDCVQHGDQRSQQDRQNVNSRRGLPAAFRSRFWPLHVIFDGGP